jgi:hypothetical protein
LQSYLPKTVYNNSEIWWPFPTTNIVSFAIASFAFAFATNNGAVVSSPVYSNANAGFYYFPGSGVHRIINAAAGNYSTNTPFSFSIWVKATYPQTSDFRGIINRGGPTGAGWFLIHLTNSIRFYLTGTSGTAFAACDVTTNLLQDNAWHMLTGTFSGGSGAGIAKLYNNATLLASSAWTPSAWTELTNAKQFQVGTWDGGYPFFGGLTEVVVVSNAVLTGAQITNMYNSRARVMGLAPIPAPVNARMDANLTISGNLTARGETTLTNTTVTGNLTMQGGNIALGTNWLSGAGQAEGVYVATGGKVGIGTNVPAAKLHVGGSLLVTGAVNMATSGGNVGIGTATPATALDVAGLTGVTIGRASADVEIPNSAILSLRRRDTSISINNNLGRIDFTGDDATQVNTAGASIRSYSDAEWTGGTDTPSRLSFWTAPSVTGVLAERMRITSAGNVGIGTDAPIATAHINGTLRVEQAQTNAGTLDVRGEATLTNTTVNGYMSVYGWNTYPVYNTASGLPTGTNAFWRFVWDPAIASNGLAFFFNTNFAITASTTNTVTNVAWGAAGSF